MWCLGTWLSGRLGGVRFMMRRDDLTGLFQPKRFYGLYDSTTFSTKLDFEGLFEMCKETFLAT